MVSNRFLPLAGLVALAACGGTAPRTFTDYATSQTDLMSRAGAEAATPGAAVPVTPGMVRYDGYLSGDLIIAGRQDLSIIGDLGLQADFGTNEITGTADRFLARDTSGAEQTLTGSLTLADGQIGRGAAAGIVSAEATGDLTDSLGRTVTTDLDLLGVFRGSSGQYILGTVTGDVTADNGAGGAVAARLDNGEFVARR